MTNPGYTVIEKVASTFSSAFGPAAARLQGASPVVDLAASAIRDHVDSDEVARDVAFHACDWASDAAFVVALHLDPDQFSEEEIKMGFIQLLHHAPNHLAAAAKLFNCPIQDIFGVGPLVEEEA